MPIEVFCKRDKSRARIELLAEKFDLPSLRIDLKDHKRSINEEVVDCGEVDLHSGAIGRAQEWLANNQLAIPLRELKEVIDVADFFDAKDLYQRCLALYAQHFRTVQSRSESAFVQVAPQNHGVQLDFLNHLLSISDLKTFDLLTHLGEDGVRYIAPGRSHMARCAAQIAERSTYLRSCGTYNQVSRVGFCGTWRYCYAWEENHPCGAPVLVWDLATGKHEQVAKYASDVGFGPKNLLYVATDSREPEPRSSQLETYSVPNYERFGECKLGWRASIYLSGTYICARKWAGEYNGHYMDSRRGGDDLLWKQDEEPSDTLKYIDSTLGEDIRLIRFSQDGRWIVCASQRAVEWSRWRDGQLSCTKKILDFEEVTPVYDADHRRLEIAVAPDGREIAMLVGRDKRLFRWMVQVGNDQCGECGDRLETSPFQDNDRPSCLAYSPSSQHLAVVSGSGSIVVFRTGEVLAPAMNENFRLLESGEGDRVGRNIKCMGWSPDGELLAIGGKLGVGFEAIGSWIRQQER